MSYDEEKNTAMTKALPCQGVGGIPIIKDLATT